MIRSCKLPVVLASVFLSMLAIAMGGKVPFELVKDFVFTANLVVVVDVKKVTKIEVPVGDYQMSNVYVAEAEVLDTLRSDITPTPEKRKIAIVVSMLPKNSGALKPIEKRRYLAFLRREQGHYRYCDKEDMRPISPEGKALWIQKDAHGRDEHLSLDIEEAIKRLRSELEVDPNIP